MTHSYEVVERSSPSDKNDEWFDAAQQNITILLKETPMAREEGVAPTWYRKLTDIYNMCSFSLIAGDSISYDNTTKSID